jgi:large subunit ribosomal protein L18
MKKGKIFTVPFRRKREGRTYYKGRMKILMSGRQRLVARKSLKGMQASIIEFNPKGDKVIVTVNSKSLAKLGWKGYSGNLSSAYLTGYLLGKKAKEKGTSEAVFDIGFSNSVGGSRLYAVLAGAVDSGLKIPHNPEILPSKERLSGEHITKYAQHLKSNSEKYSKQFSEYIKSGMAPEDFVKHFNEIKSKL